MKPALAAVPFVLLSVALERLWPTHNLVSFFLQIALCLLLIIACDWRICLDVKQRSDYSRKFAAMLGGETIAAFPLSKPWN